jgi:hypothetical protein
MDQHLELFAALAAPFAQEEVRVRQQYGRQLHYITARTVMNRLDDAVGPANWWDEYVPLENSVICRLTIRLPDGTTLTKSDAGGYAGMPDSGDDDKSGFSDAFKRAAVKFGIGRYLYRDGVPHFVQDQAHYPVQDQTQYAPVAAEPGGEPDSQTSRDGRPAVAEVAAPRPAADAQEGPQTGKGLFAWIKQQDEKHGYGLLKIISDWGKSQDFPARMVQWNEEQVRQALAEARAVIQESRQPAPASEPKTRENREPSTAGPAGKVESTEGSTEPPVAARPNSSGQRSDRQPAPFRPSRNR